MVEDRFIIRRKYLIAKRFQLKYTFMIVFFMFLIAWLAGYTVYYTVFGLLGEKLANVYPQGRLEAIFKTVNITLLARIALLIPFAVVISIILSHRIAGPLFRIEGALNEIARGDFSSILKLRKRDEFKGLAEAVNSLTENLKKLAAENKEIVDKLSSNLDELNAAISQPSLNKDKVSALAKKASEEIRDLKHRLSRYRI